MYVRFPLWFFLGFVLVVFVLAAFFGAAIGGCGPKPEPPEAMGDGFVERRVGPGFVPDATIGVHDLVFARDLVYEGAFTAMIAFSEGAKAFNAEGDDGRGSLYVTGHLVEMDPELYEVTIPEPVIGASWSSLPRVSVIRNGSPVAPISGLKLKDVELFPPCWLHLTFGKHQQDNDYPCHGACRPDLTGTVGPYWCGRGAPIRNQIETNAYLAGLPDWWANLNTGGRNLIRGRHREGQGPSGPTLYVDEWPDPFTAPPAGFRTDALTLLRYGDRACWEGGGENCIDQHCPADTYMGVAFVESGRIRAFVWAGLKGYGECWYGYPDGTRCPPVCDCQTCGGARGFQATSYMPRLVAFRASDLAAVAAGLVEPWEPQPYDVFDLSPYMVGGPNSVNVTGLAYCSPRDVPPGHRWAGRLFVSEKDTGTQYTAYPTIHVFRVR